MSNEANNRRRFKLADSEGAMDALGRMDEIVNVWQAIADMFSPEDDLHTVDRDNLACALGFLIDEGEDGRSQRIDEIFNVFHALSDLTIPGEDLHVVNRDKLGCALGFLIGEYRDARSRFTEALMEAPGS